MRISDLKQKEVINICDCKRLGYVGDVDFDMDTGCLLAIIVPGPAASVDFWSEKKSTSFPSVTSVRWGEILSW